MQRTSPRRSRARARIHDKYKATGVCEPALQRMQWLRHFCRDNIMADTFVDGIKVNAHRLLQMAHRMAVWLNRSEREARKAGELVVIGNRLWPPVLPRMHCGPDSIKSGLLAAAK